MKVKELKRYLLNTSVDTVTISKNLLKTHGTKAYIFAVNKK